MRRRAWLARSRHRASSRETALPTFVRISRRCHRPLRRPACPRGAGRDQHPTVGRGGRIYPESFGAKILIVDTGLMATVTRITTSSETVEEIITSMMPESRPPSRTSFESFIERGADDPLPWRVDDEDRIISINYTSGTTGRPKRWRRRLRHRGAYLNALGEVIHSHRHTTVYLWTLPMFHCNGWCTTWA
ncbi:MAG: AMP-binding protein [Thermomicrobiales bacterium]